MSRRAGLPDYEGVPTARVPDVKYKDDLERERHLRTARMLAREIDVPEARVIDAYERELERLDSVARVKQFLSVLAAKHVKSDLQQRKRTPA